MSLYLGLDCSTQGLTATVIEIDSGARRVRLERALSFDRDLPRYGTDRGVIRDSRDPRVVVAPPLMWAEALDAIMADIAATLGPATQAVVAIAGSAQQHGSVYLTGAAPGRIANLDPRQALAPQLRSVFSRETAPIWMDTSTPEQCAAITKALGGERAVAVLTGSRTFERFTGPQIRKFFESEPQGYTNTSRIHLVSSFMASLLAGADAPVDHGDGSGMNLMDIRARRWSPDAMEATAPGLAARLPALAHPWTIVGPLAPYWQHRHGLPPAKVIAWSGDNPCSLVGTGLVREGRLAISLGTSDTVFGYMNEPRIDPSGAGSVFVAPTGAYMGLTCFSNGSLARERVRDQYALTWKGFSEALRSTPAGNGGAIMLPWFEPEITPPVSRPGARRSGLDPSDTASNVRAVVEAQVLAMKRHSAWMGVRVDTIRATGGAARNREILEVVADVFDADVYQFEVSNSAALGAALRAYHADALATGHAVGWDEVLAGFAEPIAASPVRPTPEHVRAYRVLEPAHAQFERRALQEALG